MIGWIKLHRSIKDHWIYKEKRKFSKFEAWVDLILSVNHKDNTFVLGNEITECKRGMHITSKRELGLKWNWSITKVTSFLELLEKDKMISYFSDTKKTVISIVNYDLYQGDKKIEKLQEKNKRNSNENQEETNKNNKNLKNEKSEKEIYAPIIEYLNKKTGKNFSYRTKSTIEKIDARIREDYTLDDFKKVIVNKSDQWLEDGAMNRYLRPETLFGNNFESYLNETPLAEMSLAETHNPYAHLEIIE